ncbi:YfhD family protein [Brevibacillus sp. SYSU BS000544]
MAKTGKIADKNMPIGKSEDVQYNSRMADADDVEAQKRADAADNRQEIRP